MSLTEEQNRLISDPDVCCSVENAMLLADTVNNVRDTLDLPRINSFRLLAEEIKKWGAVYKSIKDSNDKDCKADEAMLVLRHYGYNIDPVLLDKQLLAVDKLRAATTDYMVEKIKEMQ